MVNWGVFENIVGWVQSWVNKHIKENCLMHPCHLEELVSLTCHSAHPAWYHVDDDLDDIFLKLPEAQNWEGKYVG